VRAFLSIETIFVTLAFLGFASLMYSVVNQIEGNNDYFFHESFARLSRARAFANSSILRLSSSPYIFVNTRLDSVQPFFSANLSFGLAANVNLRLMVDGLDPADGLIVMFSNGTENRSCPIIPALNDIGNHYSEPFMGESCRGDSFALYEQSCALNMAPEHLSLLIDPSECVYVFSLEVVP
jgi:hypothetical protein